MQALPRNIIKSILSNRLDGGKMYEPFLIWIIMMVVKEKYSSIAIDFSYWEIYNFFKNNVETMTRISKMKASYQERKPFGGRFLKILI
jgi:hypothetical protein